MRSLYVWFLGLTLLAQCGEVAPSKERVDRDRAILSTVTGDIVQRGILQFQDASGELARVSELACSPTGASSKEVQEAWTRAMLQWHQIEAISFGPVSEKPAEAGCTDGALSCAIYSWPLGSKKLVRRMMQEAFDEPESFDFVSVTDGARGLDAIGTILFELLTDEGSEGSFGEACPYLELLAKNVQENAKVLASAYLKSDVLSLKESKDVDQLRGGLDTIIRSLSFFEHTLLYRKINWPLKLRSRDEKGNDVFCKFGCESLIEHAGALMSVEALEVNLETLRRLVGDRSAEFGLFDYLMDLGQTEGANKLVTVVARSQEALEALPRGQEFQDLVAGFDQGQCVPKALCAFQKAAEELSRFLKIDLKVLLSVEASRGVTGDND